MNLKNSSTCPRRCEWSRLLRNLQKVMAIPGRPAQFDWQQTHSEIAWGKWCLLTSNKSKKNKKNKNKKHCCVFCAFLASFSSKIISNTEKKEAIKKLSCMLRTAPRPPPNLMVGWSVLLATRSSQSEALAAKWIQTAPLGSKANFRKETRSTLQTSVRHWGKGGLLGNG